MEPNNKEIVKFLSKVKKHFIRKVFKKKIDCKLEDYIIRSKNLYERDKELQTKYLSPLDEAFLNFIDTEAVIYFQEIYESSFPFPPWTEMLTVAGETDIRKFLLYGHICFKSVYKNIPEDIIKKANKKIKLLDFGVGCGRTMRFFFRHIDKFECFGCDVDKKSIEYLSNNIPFIDATVSHNSPPLKYENNFFDIIYCISVFTHFNKKLFELWMKEINRILSNGGIFIFSLHGKTTFDLIDKEPDRRRLIGIKDEEFIQNKDKFYDDGFLWVSQPVGSKCINTKNFGICFLDEDKIKKLIPKNFQIINYKKGEIGGWQDLVIIKKIPE